MNVELLDGIGQSARWVGMGNGGVSDKNFAREKHGAGVVALVWSILVNEAVP